MSYRDTIPDYKNTDSSVWGPKYWYVIHSYAEKYPESPSRLEKEVATNFIKSIPFILPCEDCSRHAFSYIKRNFKKIPLITANKRNIDMFFKVFHDDVNVRLGKPKMFPEFPAND